MDRHMAYIGNDQEGRPAFGNVQRAGIGIGLTFGLEHGGCPGRRAAPGHVYRRRSESLDGDKLQLAWIADARLLLTALLGFEHEGFAAVEVDAAFGGASIVVAEGDGALKGILLARAAIAWVMRAGNADEIAKIVQEGLGIARLVPVAARPSLKEALDLHYVVSPRLS